METSLKNPVAVHNLQHKKRFVVIKPDQNIMTANADSSIEKPMVLQNTVVQRMPKMLSLKLVRPQSVTLANPSVQTSTTNSTQYTMTTAPSLVVSMNNASPTEQSDEEEDDSILKDGNFVWDHKTIKLFFTKYEQHEKKFQKKKYQSKEAMFQGLAESFQKMGYSNATKNHMKNKFKLLKRKWDKYAKDTMGRNSFRKRRRPLSYEDEMFKMFGKNNNRVTFFVTDCNGVSEEEILEKSDLNLPENESESEEQSSVTNPLLLEKSETPDSCPSSRNNLSLATCGNALASSQSSITDNNSSLTSTKVKVRDGKLAHALQSVKDSVCAVLQKESDTKQEVRIKFLTLYIEELKKHNQLQKERNVILYNQLKVLERIEKKVYPAEDKS